MRAAAGIPARRQSARPPKYVLSTIDAEAPVTRRLCAADSSAGQTVRHVDH
jgi:hypothetical protein